MKHENSEKKSADPGMLNSPLPALNDLEGETVPKGFFPVIDAHVHVFPEKLFRAVWQWFDVYGWPVRYQMASKDLLKFLFDRGIHHVVAFQYAHRAGIADGLNRYMAEIQAQFQGRVTGMATVYPGEAGDREILDRAFDTGLKGLKLHVHVQCFDPAGRSVYPLYALCQDRDMPVVIHAGREPKSPGYACDPYTLCQADRIRKVLEDFPGLRLCVPHLGMDEVESYRHMAETFDNLWLDTAMAVTDYLPVPGIPDLSCFRADRLFYGSDFPNIPYAWDRELTWLARQEFVPGFLEKILYRNAARFFDIDAG